MPPAAPGPDRQSPQDQGTHSRPSTRNADRLRETVAVSLGDRSYDIIIEDGLLAEAGALIAARFPESRCFVLSDESVSALHGKRLRDVLVSAGLTVRGHDVPAGEPSKSFRNLEAGVDAVLAAGMERGDVLIAFGGGVVGDLGGFIAGIVRRGMAFVQIPTTLLAQVDSAVGGKTGINTPRGKNLVGLFNQPAMVLADTALLDTLDERQMRAGYAEVAKYGLIDKPDFFAWLEDNHAGIFAGGPARIQAVATSCRAKASVVAADEREAGSRALLNLGHTFGHALEAAVAYDGARLVHGEAVAIGMVLAHDFSVHLGHCSRSDADRVRTHLETVGLPTSIGRIPGHEAFTPDVLMDAIAQDKKVERGALTFILTRGIGQAFVARDVPQNTVREFLAQRLSE